MLHRRFVAHAAAAALAAAASLTVAAPALAVDATTTTVTAAPAASVWGQSVVLTATVADTAPPMTTPTGSVQFSDGSAAIGPSTTLTAGTASVATTALEVGQRTVTASYTPADITAFDPSNGTVVVPVARAATTTTLGASPNPAVAGQGVTLGATVVASLPGRGTPTGLVSFVNHGGSLVATAGLDPMAHASTIAYGFAGLYALDANYGGDSHFDASSGSALARVNRAATSTVLTISPNPATSGSTISFSAIVGVVAPGDVDPTGSLQFTIDGAPSGGAIALGNGAIGYQGTIIAPPGNRTFLVAVGYSGDDDTEPSSASVAVTVAGPAVAGAAASVAPVAVAQLKAMVSTLTTALRLRGFSALTSTVQTLRAGPGVVDQQVYSPASPRTARAAAKKPVVVAAGRHRFATAGTATLRLKLTSAGRRAVRHAKSLKLAIVTRYTPTGGNAITVTQRLTVRAKGRKRGGAAMSSAWRVIGTTVRR